MRPEKFPHPIPREPQNYLPPFKINDTFRTVWVKFGGEMVEARWKVIALDRMTGEPMHVDLETIDNSPCPIGRVRYCAEVSNMRPERVVYISDIKVVYQYLFRPPSKNILDACEMVERDRNNS